MCVGGSKPAPAPVEKREKPTFVRNPYLDEETTGGSSKVGRDSLSLAIPFEKSIGFEGRGGSGSGTRSESDGSLQSSPQRPANLAVVPYAGPAPIAAPRTLGPAERPAPKGHVRYQNPQTGQWGNLAVGTKRFTPDP